MEAGKNQQRRAPQNRLGVFCPQSQAGRKPSAKKSEAMLPGPRRILQQSNIAPLRITQRAPSVRKLARGAQNIPPSPEQRKCNRQNQRMTAKNRALRIPNQAAKRDAKAMDKR